MFYPKCGSEYESGHIFCANCGTRLSEGHGQGQGHDQSNMVIWFDDYLNWTLVLAMVAITVFFVVVAGVTASVSSDSDAAAVNGGVMLLCIALSMVVGAWVLRQKGRSLWWVPLALLWIGPIVWLLLTKTEIIRFRDRSNQRLWRR